jgi:hypothetical protein
VFTASSAASAKNAILVTITIATIAIHTIFFGVPFLLVVAIAVSKE